MSKLHAFNDAAMTAEEQTNTQGQWFGFRKFSKKSFSKGSYGRSKKSFGFGFGKFSKFGGFGKKW